MSKTDIAWAAGLFEGEGYISFTRNKYKGKYYPQKFPKIGLEMTDYDVLQKFQSIVGGKITKQRRRKKEYDGAKRTWIWYCGLRKDVIRILKWFQPYLGKRRLSTIVKLFGEDF